MLCELDAASAAGIPLGTAAEVLDALHVGGPRQLLSQRTIEELAGRVEAVQARVAKAEGAMARENPLVFATVQVCRVWDQAPRGVRRGQGQRSRCSAACSPPPWPTLSPPLPPCPPPPCPSDSVMLVLLVALDLPLPPPSPPLPSWPAMWA